MDAQAAVLLILTEQDREQMVDRFVAANPGYRGVEPADVLEMLLDQDAYVGVTDLFFDAHPQFDDESGALEAAYALLAAGHELTPGIVGDVLTAAGLDG